MSTNKSETLKLHLWEPEDNFLRTEFNENFAALDAAVHALEESVSDAGGAASSAVEALRSELTGQINSVRSTANSANSAANLKRYAFGYYQGTNACGASNKVTLDLGFQPSFLCVFDQLYGTYDRMFYIRGVYESAVKFTLTSTGISWYDTVSPDHMMNKNGRYFYIAFR